MKSLYANEDAFGIAVRDYLRMLTEQGYKLIVIVNGHGASNHIHTLERLAAEFTATTSSMVYYTITTFLDTGLQDFGHATRMETSIMGYLHPECVDVSVLPPKDHKLRNVDYAIVDHESFVGTPNADYTVVHDPREYDPEVGEKIFNHSIEIISKKINELIKNC